MFMPPERSVDAALNIFAKPYQTALSVLSLLRCCGGHIDRVYLQFEPRGSRFDQALPYAVASYLGERAVVHQPEYWLKRDWTEPSRLPEAAYRLSIRYQHAFERTDKKFLFILHNDVLIKQDIVGAMLEKIGGAFAIGHLGQCWNCPAHDGTAVRASGCGEEACSPGRYREFRPDLDSLIRLYREAERAKLHVRPYTEHLAEHYAGCAWPLPECRVNEWGCLVDIAQTRKHTVPYGSVLPFGSFERCGELRFDTAVAWFRGMNRLGLYARHMDVAPYLTHWVGNNKMTAGRYVRAELKARAILEKHFPGFAGWCRKQGNNMFAD
jgi:hypothetical protein